MKEQNRKKLTFTLAKHILLLVIIMAFADIAIATEYEYMQYTDISVNISSPADNTYVPINHGQSLQASADDWDCERSREPGEQWSSWYLWGDEVESGNTSSDYHMWWTAMAGTFVDMYGTTAIWTAPDYSSGQGVRNVPVTAHANDNNRGSDTSGHDDTGREDWITLKVWQVYATKRQSGTISPTYDGPDVDEEYGGNALDWVVPGNPSGTEVYGGKTELKGTIPPGVPYADTYRWCNYKEGYIRNKIVGSNDWHYDANDLSWVLDFDTSYHWIDKDPKYPNSSGPDLREVFAQDGPCFIAHSTNDHKIAYPDNWRKVDFNRDYAACVVDKDTVIRISNWCYWNVYFVLEESSNHWSVVSHTP